MSTHQTLETVLAGLMRRYRERVPDAGRVISAMHDEGIIASEAAIQNDHIAFRTMGVRHLGIQSLEKIFLRLGYQKRDQYRFPEKKLDAYWYAPPGPEYPRIFISELRVGDLSPEAQEIIYRYTGQVKSDPVDLLPADDAARIDQFLHSPLWSTPQWKEYVRLSAESEYAAWVIYNRYYLNHFTISIHDLPTPCDRLEVFNDFLLRRGFRLNDAGGTIKVSPDGKLLQSSTVAGLVEAVFAESERRMIAGSYVEFAERRVLDEFAHLPRPEIQRHHRREGFEAGNADKIFESTYSGQTGRG